MINFSIVIPNFNGAAYIQDALKSIIIASKKTPEVKYEITLVDNASTDDSLQIYDTISQKHQNKSIVFNLIRNKKNYGFAKAVNQGIVLSQYEYVVVCNNDLTIDKSWFKEISNSIKTNTNPNTVCFFGLVFTKDGAHIESEGLRYFSPGKAENINNGKVSTIFHDHPRSPIPIRGASASIVVYQKNVLTQVGMFDEDFFAYEEDVDLALRLNNLSFKTLYVPTAISYHLGGGTSSKMGNLRNRMDAKNWIYIVLKNYSLKDLFKYLIPIFIERLRNLSGLIKETIKIYHYKSVYILPYSIFITYTEVLLKIPSVLLKRSQLQKLKQPHI